jgi:hypothetical protein
MCAFRISVTTQIILWKMASYGILRLVALVRTDVSEELSTSFIRVTGIGELGTTLAVTSNRRSQSSRVFTFAMAATQSKWASTRCVRRPLWNHGSRKGKPLTSSFPLFLLSFLCHSLPARLYRNVCKSYPLVSICTRSEDRYFFVLFSFRTSPFPVVMRHVAGLPWEWRHVCVTALYRSTAFVQSPARLSWPASDLSPHTEWTHVSRAWQAQVKCILDVAQYPSNLRTVTTVTCHAL